MKLTPFKLERYFAQHEFSTPYLLCSSDCESLTAGELLDFEPDAKERFSSLWLGYTESQGNPDLRQTISTLYDNVDSEQILVHAGAEEAIFNAVHVMVKSGDQIVVHSPYYQSLGEVARGIGAEVLEWHGRPERAWELDLADLKTLLTKHTKVVVVNFPHNPTGFLPSRDFVHDLATLSDHHGFTIFADEVYRGLELDPANQVPALVEINDRAVSLGVMSKTYGLAGLRIGWIATHDHRLFRDLAAFKDYTTICNSAPSEFLATLALRNRKQIVERNVQIIRTNLDRLDSFFASQTRRFNWYRPKAGSIAFPTMTTDNVNRFCSELREKAGVLLLPGTLYGDWFNAFRIGFGRRNMPEALDRLEDYLREIDRT